VEEGGEEEKVGIADPLEPFNRAMYHFNDKLYFWVLKPVAQGYQKIVPSAHGWCGQSLFEPRLTNPFRQLPAPGKPERRSYRIGPLPGKYPLGHRRTNGPCRESGYKAFQTG